MQDALLCLMPPVFESNGEEIPFAAADGKYTAEGFAAEDKAEALGDGLFRVRRSVKNTGVGARTGKWIVEARPLCRQALSHPLRLLLGQCPLHGQGAARAVRR